MSEVLRQERPARGPRSGPPRFAIMLIIGLAGLSAGMLALYRVDWRPLIEGKNDLWSMVGAAQAFLQGRPIYDATNLCIGCYPSPFTYLPGSLLPFVPLVGIDAYLAFALFSTLSVGVFAAGVTALLRTYGGCSWARAATGGLGALLLFPVVDNISWGQSQLLLTGLIALGLVAPPIAGGVLIAIAGYYKLYPALMVAAFLLAGDRRRGIAGMVAGAALGLASLAVFGVERHLEFFRFLPRLVEFFNGPSHYASNYSLRNYLELHGFPLLIERAATVALPALWAAGAWRLRRERQLCYAFTLGAILLISPIVWRSYFLLCIPIAILLYPYVCASTARVRATYVAAVLATLTAGLNLFVPALAALPPLPLLGVLALCGLCPVLERPIRAASQSAVAQEPDRIELTSTAWLE